MASKQQSAVIAASTCAMAACLALSSAAIRQKRHMESGGRNDEKATLQDADPNNNKTSPHPTDKDIWRSSSKFTEQVDIKAMTIEASRSFDTLDSLASPLPLEPSQSVDTIPIKVPDQIHGRRLGLKDICMVVAWIALLLVKFPPLSISTEQTKSLPEVEEVVMIDPSPPCLIYDTVVSVEEGFYGVHMGNQSAHVIATSTRAIQDIPMSSLNGVYGPLVTNAPYEISLSLDLSPVREATRSVKENLAKHQVSIEEGVFGSFVANVSQFNPKNTLLNFAKQEMSPLEEGVYGPYVITAPFAIEFKLGSTGVSALYRGLANHKITLGDGVYGPFAGDTPKRVFDRFSLPFTVLEEKDGGVYGSYVGAGPSLPTDFLEAFSELQNDWSKQGICRL